MTCPTSPDHGRVYETGSGRWFCPHSDHDRGDRSKCLFTEDEVMAGHTRYVPAPAPRKRRSRK